MTGGSATGVSIGACVYDLGRLTEEGSFQIYTGEGAGMSSSGTTRAEED